MANHDFMAKDGTVIERWYSMTRKAPKKIKVGRKFYYRQIGAGEFVSVEKNYCVTAYQFDEEDAKLAPRKDQDDFPVLLTKREIRDFAHKVNDRSKGKDKFEYQFGLHDK
jgi:hypothetical protein